MSSPTPIHLLDLVDELLISIISYLENDKPSLLSLLITCHRLRSTTQPILDKNILLLSAHASRNITSALDAQALRVRSIRKLNLRIEFGAHEPLGDTGSIDYRVEAMTGLREFEVESPFCNYRRWRGPGAMEWSNGSWTRYKRMFERASLASNLERRLRPLQMLQKLTIHSHALGTDFWELETYPGMQSIFLHPNIRYIHLSTCWFYLSPRAVEALKPFHRATPLKELILEECIIPELSALEAILDIPKALRHLTVHENANHAHDPFPPLPKELANALLPQKHSLQTFRHIDATAGRNGERNRVSPAEPGDDPFLIWEQFTTLERLELASSSLLIHWIQAGHAPPNIKTLRILFNLRHARNGVSYDPEPIDTSQMKALELFEVEEHRTYHKGGPVPGLIISYLIRELHRWAYRLHKQGVRLKSYRTLRDRLFPPFLWGETVPEPLCVYDSQEDGFWREAPPDPVILIGRLFEDGKELEEWRNGVPERTTPEMEETDRLTDDEIKEMAERARRIGERWMIENKILPPQEV